VIQLIKL